MMLLVDRSSKHDIVERTRGVGKLGRPRGFSLVEILIVMTIIGITAAIATPNITATIRAYRAGAAARQLMTDLQFAKMGAVSQRVNYRVSFDAGQNRYWIERWNAATAAWNTVDAVRALATPGTPYFTQGAALNVAFTGGNAFVEFTPLGVASSNGVATVRVGSAARNISVNAIGRVRIDVSA
jgi:type IV fimbrial biogenesis protein FimU